MKHSSLQILALATDYDDTLAEKGRIAPQTLAALARFKNSGRQLVLVTGRQLDDLLDVCPQIGIFDLVVAENGALLYRPADGETKSLAGPPPVDFLQRLRELDVKPLAAGRSVIATTRPNYDVVRRTILEMRLEMEIIFNRDAVMVLPSGIDKSSGLSVALEQALRREGARLGSIAALRPLVKRQPRERLDHGGDGTRGETTVLVSTTRTHGVHGIAPKYCAASLISSAVIVFAY